jgi:hypothetical protein
MERVRLPRKPNRPQRPQQAQFPPTLVPVLDAADMLRVRVSQMYDAIDQGDVDSLLIGGKRYVTRQSLERLTARRQAADGLTPERRAINDVVDAIDAAREPNPDSLETAINAFEEILTFLRPFVKGKAAPPEAAESVR